MAAAALEQLWVCDTEVLHVCGILYWELVYVVRSVVLLWCRSVAVLYVDGNIWGYRRLKLPLPMMVHTMQSGCRLFLRFMTDMAGQHLTVNICRHANSR